MPIVTDQQDQNNEESVRELLNRSPKYYPSPHDHDQSLPAQHGRPHGRPPITTCSSLPAQHGRSPTCPGGDVQLPLLQQSHVDSCDCDDHEPMALRQNSEDPSTSSGYSTTRMTHTSPSPSTLDSEDTRLSASTLRSDHNIVRAPTIAEEPGYTPITNHVTFSDTLQLRERSPVELQDEEECHERVQDGGYGWVIVAASFAIQMIGIGLTLSFGVFYVELQEYFHEGGAVTSWVGALCVGLSLGAGPISSVMANAFGHRRSCIFGSIITAAGLFISAFSPNIFFLYGSYGIVTGLGISLTYVPAVVMVGFYFERRRSMASGLAVAGVGVGCLIYAPLIQYLIDTYTWRGAMIILSAISLHMCVFACLLRPLAVTNQTQVKLCNLGVLKDWCFVTFSLAEVLWNVGALIIITIAPHQSVLQGTDHGEAAFLLSVIGITGIIGRVSFGFFPLHWDKLTIMTAVTYISGLPMVLYPLYAKYWLYVIYCVVYGLCFGLQLAVLPVVTVDLFGLQHLTTAYGYLMLADGIGALIGPFLAGHFYDMTGAYHTSFIFGAISSFLAGILMTVIIVVNACSNSEPIHSRASKRLVPRIQPPEPCSEIFL